MTPFFDLRLSGARDAFGHLFRDWLVVGWEEGRVPDDCVCLLPVTHPAAQTAQPLSVSPQLELFA